MTTTVLVNEESVTVVSAATQGPAGPQGATGAAGPAGPQGALGPTGPQGPQATAAPVLMGTVSMTAATNVTIVLVSYAQYQCALERLDNLRVSSGSITLDIQINDVSVTGFTGILVTTTPQSPVGSFNNVLNVGDRLTLVLSGGTLASNFEFTMKATTST